MIQPHHNSILHESFYEMIDALTFYSCAALWPGDVQLYPAQRSEQPTGRTGMVLQYLVVFDHGGEA